MKKVNEVKSVNVKLQQYCFLGNKPRSLITTNLNVTQIDSLANNLMLDLGQIIVLLAQQIRTITYINRNYRVPIYFV